MLLERMRLVQKINFKFIKTLIFKALIIRDYRLDDNYI
jgi:hypothetical protein